MYERFTDRARKVMQLANQEAQRFNHKYVGTEHILLGLVKEGSGVAANVLKNLDIDLGKIRLEVEKFVEPGREMVTMGRLPQTDHAKNVIQYAIDEAKKLNHNYVGTEHLLLGLLREKDGIANKVLSVMMLSPDSVRMAVMEMLGREKSDEATDPSVLLPDASRLLSEAVWRWQTSNVLAVPSVARVLTEMDIFVNMLHRAQLFGVMTLGMVKIGDTEIRCQMVTKIGSDEKWMFTQGGEFLGIRHDDEPTPEIVEKQ